jgi:hypothetical protein
LTLKNDIVKNNPDLNIIKTIEYPLTNVRQFLIVTLDDVYKSTPYSRKLSRFNFGYSEVSLYYDNIVEPTKKYFDNIEIFSRDGIIFNIRRQVMQAFD